MTIFDHYYFSIFNTFKQRFKQKANTIALFYISFLQIAILFVSGAFLITFLSKMNVNTPSTNKVIAFFVIGALSIHIKNWLKYNGKTRMVLKAKRNREKVKDASLLLLFIIPIVCIALGFIVLKSF